MYITQQTVFIRQRSRHGGSQGGLGSGDFACLGGFGVGEAGFLADDLVGQEVGTLGQAISPAATPDHGHLVLRAGDGPREEPCA